MSIIYVLPTSIRYRGKIKDMRWSRIHTMPFILVLPINGENGRRK